MRAKYYSDAQRRGDQRQAWEKEQTQTKVKGKCSSVQYIRNEGLGEKKILQSGDTEKSTKKVFVEGEERERFTKLFGGGGELSFHDARIHLSYIDLQYTTFFSSLSLSLSLTHTLSSLSYQNDTTGIPYSKLMAALSPAHTIRRVERARTAERTTNGGRWKEKIKERREPRKRLENRERGKSKRRRDA